jgi:hypothetical protein
VGLTADPKWWRHGDITISGVRMAAAAAGPPHGQTSAFDVAGLFGGAAILAGCRLLDIAATGFSNPFATLGPLLGCEIRSVALDSPLTLTGLVAPAVAREAVRTVPRGGRRIPFGVTGGLKVGMFATGPHFPYRTRIAELERDGTVVLDQALTGELSPRATVTFHGAGMLDEVPVEPGNATRISQLSAAGLGMVGSHGAVFDDVRSRIADGVGVRIAGCADIHFGAVQVMLLKRGDGVRPAVTLDPMCRRVRIDRLRLHQGGEPNGPLVVLESKDAVSIGTLEIHASAVPHRPAVQDRAMLDGERPQVETVRVLVSLVAGAVSH